MEQQTNQPEINRYEDVSDLASGQGTSFKTSFLGFDKDDVIAYIDGLVRDVSDQKKSLENSLGRLTDQNRDLIERVNRYEQRIHLLQQELDEEKTYNQNAHEREELFKKAVAILQEKVAFLQNNTVSPTGGTDTSFEEQTKRANEIVLRLREELLRKDENVSRLSEELSRRNDIILNQDKILAVKDRQVLEQTKAMEEQKQQILVRADEINRLAEQLASLRSRVGFLEQKRNEVIVELNETRARLQALLQQRQNEREEIERVGRQLRAERENIEAHKRQLQSRYEEVDRIRQQQSAEYETLLQRRQRQQGDEQKMQRMREEIRFQAEQLETMKEKLAFEQNAVMHLREQNEIQAKALEERVKRQGTSEREQGWQREDAHKEQERLYRESSSDRMGYGAPSERSDAYESVPPNYESRIPAHEENWLYAEPRREQQRSDRYSPDSMSTPYYGSEQQPQYWEPARRQPLYENYMYSPANFESDVKTYVPEEMRRPTVQPQQQYRQDLEPVSYYQGSPQPGYYESRYTT